MDRPSLQALGAAGEDAAAVWLAGRGYQVLARNVRTRHGEIDLVARLGSLIVFVEVKSRRGERYGHPSEAIGRQKQRRLTKLAAACLCRLGLAGHPVRFDAIAVWLERDGAVARVEHIPDAFQAGG